MLEVCCFFSSSPKPFLTTKQMMNWNQTRHSTCRTQRWQMELCLNSFVLPVPIKEKYTKAQVWWEKGKCSECESESGNHTGDESHLTRQHTATSPLRSTGRDRAVAGVQRRTARADSQRERRALWSGDGARGKPARFLICVGLVGEQQLLLLSKNQASWGCGTALS